MTALLWRLARAQTIEALVMGTLVAQARRRQAALGSLPARAHPIADLSGQSVEVIGEAVLDAIDTAHPADEPEPAAGGLCPSCDALIEVAAGYADPTRKVWPDPLRYHLAGMIDAALADAAPTRSP